jgi:DNA uptake protein ComE-like DNA-binding protein
MKSLLFPYRFTKGQQKGIVALFVVIAICQAVYFVLMSYGSTNGKAKSEEEKQWLALQSQIDELKAKKASVKEIIYPFNPNFISDYKGYTLGMSTEEIDRLHKFRETGKFINSPEDFQQVTKISDTLLAQLRPYFKFPDWVNSKQSSVAVNSPDKHDVKQQNNLSTTTAKERKVTLIDINDALEEDLDKVYGIGPAFAKKILRRRATLGGYVSMEQMADFKEFSPEAIKDLEKHFGVLKTPQVNKININSASLNQLSYFPYFNKSIAKGIITQRSMKGKISGIEDLLNINDFPVDKVQIIALYLEF